MCSWVEFTGKAFLAKNGFTVILRIYCHFVKIQIITLPTYLNGCLPFLRGASSFMWPGLILLKGRAKTSTIGIKEAPQGWIQDLSTIVKLAVKCSRFSVRDNVEQRQSEGLQILDVQHHPPPPHLPPPAFLIMVCPTMLKKWRGQNQGPSFVLS